MEIWDAVKFKKYFPTSRISLLRKRKFYMEQAFVEIVSGACLMVRRKAFDNIGGWDEDYFLYFEDDDLCYRLNKSGWIVSYYPESKVIHYGGKRQENLENREKKISAKTGETSRCLNGLAETTGKELIFK